MANVTFGQYANNLAKQRVRQQEHHDRTVLVGTIVGLIFAIAVIFGWVVLSRQSPVGNVTAELFQHNQLSTRSQGEQSKPLEPAPFPTGVGDQQPVRR